MRILIAGSSGFLGSRLVARLRSGGHEVVRLVRRSPNGPDEIRWDPTAGRLDRAVVSDVDAIVNLAGAGVGDKRWTDAYKRTLLTSRVEATSTIATAIAAHGGPRPPTLLNSSAVGFYGDTGDTPVDERSRPGQGFFAELCVEWEAATRPAGDAGARVVHLRTGFPLSRDGGVLKPFYLQFRAGVGGKLGNGRQYMPCLSLPDWLGAIEFLLDRDDLSGPVNLTGPVPVTNATFASTLARLLHRPSLIPAPGFALRLLVGEFGGEVLVSQRVLPGVLTGAGYQFRHPTVADTLRWAITEKAPAA